MAAALLSRRGGELWDHWSRRDTSIRIWRRRGRDRGHCEDCLFVIAALATGRGGYERVRLLKGVANHGCCRAVGLCRWSGVHCTVQKYKTALEEAKGLPKRLCEAFETHRLRGAVCLR